MLFNSPIINAVPAYHAPANDNGDWPSVLSTKGFDISRDWEPGGSPGRYEELSVVRKDSQGKPAFWAYQNTSTGVTEVQELQGDGQFTGINPQGKPFIGKGSFYMKLDTKQNTYTLYVQGQGMSTGSLDNIPDTTVFDDLGVKLVKDTAGRGRLVGVQLLNDNTGEQVSILDAPTQTGSGRQLAVMYWDRPGVEPRWLMGQ